MKFDIIVPTFNLPEITKMCFARVAKYTENFKLIWIDNNSDTQNFDSVLDFVKSLKIEYECFRLKSNLGFVKATNLGLAVSTAPWKVFLNNDVYVTKDWLNNMVLCAETNNLDIVGPLTSPNTGSHQNVHNIKNKLRNTIPEVLDYNFDDYALKLKETMFSDFILIQGGMIAFFCTLISEKVIKRIGYLSEAFGIGFGDDDDFCNIALKNKFRIGIDLSTYVYHDHRSTFKSLYTSVEIQTMQNRALQTFYERKNNLI